MGDDFARANSLLPLTPAAFSILLALAGGEKHGYAIMREIAGSSAGALRVGPGTLYRSIKQLLADQGVTVRAFARVQVGQAG